MTEETEPPWKAALRKSIHGGAVCADGCDSCTESHMNAIMAAVLPHMESSYTVGRMKATARIGRRYVERNLTLTRKLRRIRDLVTEYRLGQDRGVMPKGSHFVGWVQDVLSEDGDASEAEAEIRKKALLEAADAVAALDYYELREGFEYDHVRDAWNGGTSDATDLLRRRAEDGQ